MKIAELQNHSGKFDLKCCLRLVSGMIYPTRYLMHIHHLLPFLEIIQIVLFRLMHLINDDILSSVTLITESVLDFLLRRVLLMLQLLKC